MQAEKVYIMVYTDVGRIAKTYFPTKQVCYSVLSQKRRNYIGRRYIYAEAEEMARFMASINRWDDRPVYCGKLERIAISYLMWVFQQVIVDVKEVSI